MKQELEKLYSHIADIEIAMMTTRRADGHLQSRAMATQKRALGADLWFATLDSAPKLRDLDNDTHVNLSYYKDRTREWGVVNWSPDDFKAHIDFMKAIHKRLKDAGELVGAEGLASPGQARLVRAGKNGVPEVTDGPFAEAKEFLAGYWIVDVDAPQRAYEIAAAASAAPGPGGTPINMAIEVREVMSGPPDV